jgi:hypothetical protein
MFMRNPYHSEISKGQFGLLSGEWALLWPAPTRVSWSKVRWKQIGQPPNASLVGQGVDTRSLQHYLGHKNIQHTVRYSELSPERFRDFWKD